MRTAMIWFGMACSMIGAGLGFSNHDALAILFLCLACLNLLAIRMVRS